MLSVPDPHPNDPEGVVSALETAAIFGTQGDLKEAVRWVRKAAEIAGDEGNDERALTLARAIADLNISASQPPQPPSQAAPAVQAPPAGQAAPPEPPKAPPPPPLPNASAAPIMTAAANAYDPDGDAETRVVESAQMLAEFQKQMNGNGAAHAAPPLPPPSISSVATPVATPAEMVAAVAAFADEPLPPPPPAPTAAAADTAPDFAREEESTPPSRSGIGSMAELLARKEAEVSDARAAADAALPEAAHADAAWEDLPPPPPAPQASVPPLERRTAHPAAERIQTPLIPSQPYLDRPPVNAPVHQAVRGSIVATAEPGVFVLRVLTADQSPAPTGHEVLVVVTDPSSSPFK